MLERKTVAVVRKMSADERTLYEIEKREEALREEKSAISFATKKGIEQGIQQGATQERNAMIARLKSKGFTDKQIADLLAD